VSPQTLRSASVAITATGGDVPLFTPVVLRPRASRFCVLVTVIDEGSRLAHQLERMRAQMSAIDVIVCDGGSTDGSTDSDRMRAAGVRTLLITRQRERFSSSLRVGFQYALSEGYDGVITVDGNDKDGVDAIPRFIEKLQAGFDFVQGSRFLPDGAHEHTPWSRYLAIRLLHVPIVRRISRFPYTDTTNGFRAHSARLLRDPRLQLFRPLFDGYELPFYIAIRAPRIGLRVAELPVARRYPPGEVPTKIPPIHGPIELLAVLARIARNQFDPPLIPQKQDTTTGSSNTQKRTITIIAAQASSTPASGGGRERRSWHRSARPASD
jgi:dolichol-phosphate mannosyltransferase